MLRFNQKDGMVQVEPSSLMIEQVRDIWNSDETPDKRKATRYLTYIHLVSRIDHTAPFFGAREDEVRELARRNTWRNEEAPSELLSDEVEEVITAYIKAFESAEMRIVKIYGDKIDQIHDLIKITAPQIERSESTSGAVSFRSNIDILLKTMKDMGPLLDAKEEIEQKIRKASDKATIRGGKEPSLLEKRKRQNTQNNEQKRASSEKEFA